MKKKSDKSPDTIKVRPKQAMEMLLGYAGGKLADQLRAVAFVVIYLLVSQLFIFKVPLHNAVSLALGVASTVLGLTLFLEGLFLGIMPLGEQCGLRLPARAGKIATILFALVIGVTATLAEPAIGILKAQGSSVQAWNAPLLYFLLNRGSSYLVAAVAVGVGLAVMLGVFRFLYNWSFKPLVFIIIPFIVAAGFFFQFDPLLSPVAGLAWDTGAVTTGPVTVPLIIALGVGISRISGGRRDDASGLGVVTLASSLPVAAVFTLALFLAPLMPQASVPQTFFASDTEQRQRAEFLGGGSGQLEQLALKACEQGYISEAEYNTFFPHYPDTDASREPQSAESVNNSFASYLRQAVLAILPLALVLMLTLLIIIREKIRNADEVFLGLFLALTGMFFFSFGMERGLSSLGSQAGSSLPKAYESTLRPDKAVLIQHVTEDQILRVPGTDKVKEYVWIQTEDQPSLVPFVRENWDQDSMLYRHIPVEKALFSRWGSYAGMLAVLVFVFILGFGSTLAEPSLAALGITVEELTTGTYKRKNLVAVVAIGVGLGMAAGFIRILYDFPLAWFLGIPYAAALFLTLFSSEEFASIAWDVAGVTTGPITVPLVMAAGLGIGAQAGASGAFGVVASASIYPVIAVLLSGIISAARAKRSIGETNV